MEPLTTQFNNILHFDADAFFASVEQGFAPPLRNRPVIVGGTEEQRGVVHTASYDARKQGVRTGMPLKQAKELVPDAVSSKVISSTTKRSPGFFRTSTASSRPSSR